MLITSKIDGKKWLWVNVPKTASTAVMRTFFPNIPINTQSHNTYNNLIDMYGSLDAFTTVRNPITRFKSALNHSLNACACGKCQYSNMSVNTIDIIHFLSDIVKLKKNRNDFFDLMYMNNITTYEKQICEYFKYRFKKHVNTKNNNCLRIPAYVSQTFMLKGPQDKLHIFKYENLQELSGFIQDRLGYEMDNTIYRKYPNKLGVDFYDPTLLDLLHELYREDYDNFNYGKRL